MKASKRYVFDTNTLISAAIFKSSIPAKALYVTILSDSLAFSPEILDEFLTVLSRQKFDRYLTEKERRDFMTMVLQCSTLVEEPSPIVACRDPKDDQFLALAIAAQAAAIVTGDSDLLVLNPFQDVIILQPADFLDSFT